MRLTVSSMLFLTAVLYLPTGQGQHSYSQLQPAVKKFVDLAINNGNLNLGHQIPDHLNLYEIGLQKVSSSHVIIDVRLRETTCKKASGVEHRHRPECQFKEKAQVRCFVCQHIRPKLEPFVNCIRRREEKTRHAIWKANCPAPLPGSFGLFAAEEVSEELICYSGNGREYRGAVNKTISGKTCQSWSAQTPHSHDRTPENYPCKGLDNNYCRNPDRKEKPWCYTTDSEERWEYCDVPLCDVAPEPASEPTSTFVPEMTCFTCDGVNYRGTVAKTISGKTCQLWTAQTPHKHISITPEKHPHKGLDSNYCRNPDNERKPWCYTTDSQTRWEYCQVPRCVPDY